MGGSVGKSESDSSSQSSFNQDVWPTQSSALQKLYNNASGVFDRTNRLIKREGRDVANYMDSISEDANPTWQSQLQGGAYQNMGLQNALMNSLNQSLNNPSNMSQINAMIMGGEGNNYADAMKEQYLQDADMAHERLMSNLTLGAVDAGQSGSSRHGIAQALGTESIAKELQRNLAETGFNSFDADLDRKLKIAEMADQNTLARQNLMSNMIGQQNATTQNALNTSPIIQNLGMGTFAPYMMPWQVMGNYANVLGQPTVLGSGNMAGSSDSKGFSLAGGM